MKSIISTKNNSKNLQKVEKMFKLSMPKSLLVDLQRQEILKQNSFYATKIGAIEVIQAIVLIIEYYIFNLEHRSAHGPTLQTNNWHDYVFL